MDENYFNRSFQARARIDKRTKNLVRRLSENDIAVIDHKDVDRVSAESLVQCKPSVVLNTMPMISGRYPSSGASLLKDAGIHLIDNLGPDFFGLVKEGDKLSVVGGAVYKNDELLMEGRELSWETIQELLEKSRQSINCELEKFAENTLKFIREEKSHVLDELEVPESGIDFRGRHALIVVRGHNYKEDFKTLRSYIKEIKPVFIAVDGGADLLLEYGYRPDVIIGDMDSVSDRALESADEIILHAYMNGMAPGMQKLDEIGINYKVFKAKATSEDLALLYAFEHGAELISAIGTHNNLEDFLDKGREGMASTFLTRLKIGSRFVDAKGVYKLFRGSVMASHLLILVFSALVTASVIILVSPQIQQFLKLVMIWISLSLGL